MIRRLFLATATLTALAGAQVDPCPHDVIDPKDSSVTYGTVMECGSNVNVNWNGIQVGGPTVGCPTFAIVTPSHNSTKHEDDSNTYTMPVGRVEVTLLNFRCSAAARILWIIPIGSTCKLVSHRVINRLRCYEQYPCAISPRDHTDQPG